MRTCAKTEGLKDGFGCLRGAERARNGHEDCLKMCKRPAKAYLMNLWLLVQVRENLKSISVEINYPRDQSLEM